MKYYKDISKQGGAALILCLILLLIMTILGFNSLATSTMEEKMSGSSLNKHISFQSAEAALRSGEQVAQIAGQSGDLFSKAGAMGLYEKTEPGDSNYPLWDYDIPDTNWEPVPKSAEAYRDAEYIIEELTTVSVEETCEYDMEKVNKGLCPKKTIYRVTARGWGQNVNGKSIIQTTYKQK